MRPIAKVALVLGGYVAAFAMAAAFEAAYIAATSHIDRYTYSGMTAFGDSLVFLGAFSLAAVPATGAALFFLRPYRRLWLVCSAIAVAIAATGLLAGIDYVVAPGAATNSVANAWSAFAILRLLMAPICAGAFLLAALFAPSRGCRVALLLATLLDGAGFAVFAVTLLARATR